MHFVFFDRDLGVCIELAIVIARIAAKPRQLLLCRRDQFRRVCRRRRRSSAFVELAGDLIERGNYLRTKALAGKLLRQSLQIITHGRIVASRLEIIEPRLVAVASQLIAGGLVLNLLLFGFGGFLRGALLFFGSQCRFARLFRAARFLGALARFLGAPLRSFTFGACLFLSFACRAFQDVQAVLRVQR